MLILDHSPRALLRPDTECTYGSLNTEVVFNNSLQDQGDLLVRLPFHQVLHLFLFRTFLQLISLIIFPYLVFRLGLVFLS